MDITGRLARKLENGKRPFYNLSAKEIMPKC